MRKLLVILFCACAPACVSTTNPNRDLCVGRAAIEYQEAINVCKAEQLSYDECVSKYDIENSFEAKQKDCR